MECPTCGKDLDTEQGMRQHHTKVHGDPLPNRTCRGCGTEFYDPKARRKYCEECNPNAGQNNGNWRDAKETASCRICGDEFEFYPSDKKGVYCPECVTSSEGLLPENPSEPIERMSVECEECGAEINVLPSRMAKQPRGFFCDRDCYGKWLSENIVGENHHQWQGGEIPYGKRWWRIRREALDRDDHTCQNCGRTRSILGKEPDVHHIIPVRDFDDPQDAHSLGNVIVLCRSCHRHAEEGDISEFNSEP